MNKYFMFQINVFLLFLFILISGRLEAQDATLTFKDGKVIEGQMEFNNWLKKTDEIKIRVDDKWIVYDANKVTEFEIYGQRYIRKTVDVNSNNQNLQNLKNVLTLESEEKTVFLKVIALGKLDLYSYIGDRVHYFVSKDDTTFIELIRLKRANRPALNKYLGQLNILFSDCNNPPKIENIKFKKSSLKKSIIAYNNCVGENSYEGQESKVGFQTSFHLLAGVNFTSYDLGRFDITTSENVNPTFGVGFEIDLYTKNRKLKFYNELFYNQYKAEGFFSEPVSFVQTFENFINIDLNYLDLNTFIKYEIGNTLRDVNFYINGGVANSFVVSNNSTQRIESTFLDQEVQMAELEPLGGEISDHLVRFLFGFGVEYNSIRAEVRYASTSLFSESNIAEFSNTTLLFSYKLF